MRLIDADELLKKLPREELVSRIIVAGMPIIDPVKRGHWVGIDDFPYETWECDQCGYIHEELGGWVPKYCPDCGAKMEEDE